MAGLAARGVAAGATVAGARVLARVKEGRCTKAVLWGIPMVAAAFVLWYMRK
ncbi:MAG: hypothetical protein ABSC19_18590 [Syntrophorhabdales bacterium]|jgi:hypothetical protein